MTSILLMVVPVAIAALGIVALIAGVVYKGKSPWSKRLGALLLALIFFSGAARIVFFGVSVQLGGFASAGKIEAGRYYLGSHGTYREVSRKCYRLSLGFDDLSAKISDGGVLVLLSALLIANRVTPRSSQRGPHHQG